MKTFSRRRSLLRGVGVIASFAMVALGAGAAHAAPISNIDPSAESTLNIHKFLQPDVVRAEGNGLVQDTSGLTPLSDITFSVQQVRDVDLTTNAGWEVAGNMTVQEAVGALTGTPVTGTTDGTGLATIPNLAVGLYLVTETGFPAGTSPVEPFLVTLPMTHPVDLDEWLYEVHVYPKNSVTNAEKSVQDAEAVKLGEDISWTIDADIPKKQNIDGYKIVDVLDARLDYVGAEVALTGTPGQTITLGPDYTIVETPDNTVTIDFTEAGRVKLAAAWEADPTSQVRVVITTTVLESGETDNVAIVYPNAPSFEVDAGAPGGPIVTEPVTTKFGAIVLEKVDSKVSETKLEGAEFQVFASEADADVGTNPIEINGENTFVSGAGGLVVIDGLRFTNFANGETLQQENPGYRTYWIVETKAPGGYELLAEPIEVEVLRTSTTEVTTQVKNVTKNAGFQLPLTGATGTMMLTVAGLVLLVGGLTAALISRRKRNRTTN